MSKSDSTGGYRRTWWPLFSKEKAIVGHESVFGWADDWAHFPDDAGTVLQTINSKCGGSRVAVSKSERTDVKRAWWPLFAKEKAIVGHESIFGWADDWRISRMTPAAYQAHRAALSWALQCLPHCSSRRFDQFRSGSLPPLPFPRHRQGPSLSKKRRPRHGSSLPSRRSLRLAPPAAI